MLQKTHKAHWKWGDVVTVKPNKARAFNTYPHEATCALQQRPQWPLVLRSHQKQKPIFHARRFLADTRRCPARANQRCDAPPVIPTVRLLNQRQWWTHTPRPLEDVPSSTTYLQTKSPSCVTGEGVWGPDVVLQQAQSRNGGYFHGGQQKLWHCPFFGPNEANSRASKLANKAGGEYWL